MLCLCSESKSDKLIDSQSKHWRTHASVCHWGLLQRARHCLGEQYKVRFLEGVGGKIPWHWWEEGQQEEPVNPEIFRNNGRHRMTLDVCHGPRVQKNWCPHTALCLYSRQHRNPPSARDNLTTASYQTWKSAVGEKDNSTQWSYLVLDKDNVKFLPLEQVPEMINHKNRLRGFDPWSVVPIALELWQCVMVVTCGKENCHPMVLMWKRG